MEESPYRQFGGDRHVLQIKELTGMRLQVKQWWLKCYNCQEEDNGDTIIPAQASQEILSPAAFQTDDLDAFDYDCDERPTTKAVLMANLSSYDSNVISE
nr:hypothetical protein [Tanacetum cinerariifolium]